MLEIKFRGMTLSGKWVYGLLAHSEGLKNQVKKGYYISNKAGSPFAYDIRPETIGQFTGLKDKNGKEIYEGDIVKAWSEGKSAVGKVMQRIDGLWLLYPAWQGKEFWGLCPNNKGNTTVEVIGNIYENPELIE